MFHLGMCGNHTDKHKETRKFLTGRGNQEGGRGEKEVASWP